MGMLKSFAFDSIISVWTSEKFIPAASKRESAKRGDSMVKIMSEYSVLDFLAAIGMRVRRYTFGCSACEKLVMSKESGSLPPPLRLASDYDSLCCIVSKLQQPLFLILRYLLASLSTRSADRNPASSTG